MAAKRSAEPLNFKVRDNVPEGCVVSLAGIPAAASFASMFRSELQARGLGLLPREEARRERKKLD